MKIKLAKNCGFCFGVKRAIKMAESAPNAFTIGPLIHNNEEIFRLKEKFNVGVLSDINEAENTITAIIRTHGITKEELKCLKEKEIKIVDATCPFVAKPQKICEDMSKNGYSVVIFGDKNHPEVKGVKSYCDHDKIYVVSNMEELSGINLGKKIAFISQTTKKIDEFLKIADFLIMNYKEVRVFNTICNATFENQDAALSLAKESDVFIVAGGKNSSNTKQLYAIAKEFCADSYLVENEEELNKEWFKNKKMCGITAGASTPDWIIQKIIGKIREIKV